jgi:hypothetical protein
MTPRQIIFAGTLSVLVFVTIITLVKKGKLREEFSWLWLLIGVALLMPVFLYDFLLFLTRLSGAVLPTTTLFILSIIFLTSLSLHLAIKISSMSDHVKNLAQKVSLLEAENDAGGIAGRMRRGQK